MENFDKLTMPLFRENLEERARSGCQVPGCKHDHPLNEIWLHQNCHPGTGADVCYRAGSIYLVCHRCKAPIAVIAVAHR